MGLCTAVVLGEKKKLLMKRTGGEKKSCWPSLPISVSQSDEVIKHQPALYINDVTARDFFFFFFFWTPLSPETAWLEAEEDFILI